MLNLELRSLDKLPLQRQLRFTPNLQIELCIKNFLKHLQATEVIEDEFSPENIMKHIYINGKEIEKKKFFRDYKIHDGDKIIVSDYNIKKKKKRKKSPVKFKMEDLDISNAQTDKQLSIKEIIPKKKPKIIKEPEIPTKKRNIWIYILIISLICLIIAIILLVVLLILKKKKKNSSILNEEDLIIDIRYRVNETIFFINKRINNSTMIYNQKLENQKTETFTNFSITITNEYQIDNKLCYSAYLVILNMTSSNETASNLDASFDLFNSSSINNKYRSLEDNDINIDLSNNNFNDINISQYINISKYIDTSNFTQNEINDLINQFKSLPIIKFEFFRNGKIKDIYLPKYLKTNIFYNIYDLIDKVIPKISTELYQYDYDTIFGNETKVVDDDENEVEEEIEEEEGNENNDGRRLEIQKNEESINTYRAIGNNSDDNLTNLIEISKTSAESGEMKLEGSSINSNIERKYNNDLHKIENINYNGEASLVNQLPNEEEQYNELLEQNTQSNILDVDLKQIDIKTENTIEFIKNITDKKIISILDDVFSKMEIIRYNESEYGNSTLRILNNIPINDVKVVKRSENKIWKHVQLYKTKKIAKTKN